MTRPYGVGNIINDKLPRDLAAKKGHMTQKTFLVVGGAGYIGSHMVKMLLENHHHVVEKKKFVKNTTCPRHLLVSLMLETSYLEKSAMNGLMLQNQKICIK